LLFRQCNLLDCVCNPVNVLDGVSINQGNSISIRHIFSDNCNWEVYLVLHRDGLREVEISEVDKMLSCDEKGYRVFMCPVCGEVRTVFFGCNSRLCTHCGKSYTDKWAERVARSTFNVLHRHVVLTIPEDLRKFFLQDRRFLKVLMDCAIKTLGDVLCWRLKSVATPGVVVVLHTFGKDMKFNPHLHCLVTEGGFKKNGTWVQLGYFPYELLRKSWQYQVLTSLKAELEDSYENRRLIDSLFKRYSKGFYVRAKDTIRNKKGMMKYIGRYIKHPAIAESRISSYDGKSVCFWHEEDNGTRKYVSMSVDEFITAVIRHIPDEQFKTIRHYGVYSRGLKKKFRALRYMVSIAQAKITEFLKSWAPKCPKCGTNMQYVCSLEGKPPPKQKFGEKITDWSHMTTA